MDIYFERVSDSRQKVDLNILSTVQGHLTTPHRERNNLLLAQNLFSFFFLPEAFMHPSQTNLWEKNKNTKVYACTWSAFSNTSPDIFHASQIDHNLDQFPLSCKLKMFP